MRVVLSATKATQIMDETVAEVTFGEWLKRRRGAQGLTQKQLAEKLNCSVSTLRKLEVEERHPSLQLVERLIEILDIPQNKQKSFQRFARGDWQAGIATDIDLRYGDNQASSRGADLPRSIMSFINTKAVDEAPQFTWESPNLDEKLLLIQQALAMAEANGNTHKQAEYLWQLGWLDQTNRFTYWEKALTLARLDGDTRALASGLSMIGFFLILDGDLSASQKYLMESGDLYQQLQVPPIASHLLSSYGQIAIIRGDFEKARAYLEEHIEACLQAGHYREEYLWSSGRLGYVALREGNLQEAYARFSEIAQEFRKDQNTIGVIFMLEGIAICCLELGHPHRATQLISWADSTREKISNTRPPLEQIDMDKTITACKAKMGKAAFADAYEDGQKMTMDEAVELAMKKQDV